MEKRLILVIFIIFLFSSSVQAKTIKVEALDNFSTVRPSTTFMIKTIEAKKISNDIILPTDTLISGIVLRVESPKPGKRDAYFEFLPVSLLYQGKTMEINNSKLTAKIVRYKPIKPEKLACDAARKAANFFFKGAISAIEFVYGAIKAESGHRIKSGVINVYNDSFLSYISVGKELNIKTGDILVLKIKKIR